MLSCSKDNKNRNDISDDFDFVLLDENRIQDEKIIKLSELLYDYDIVRFENSDSAIFRVRKPVLSENHIAIIQGSSLPVMLFDREGNFKGTVGNIGQGPGEYMSAFDAVIDEKNRRIYVVETLTDRIIEYDIDGKYLKTHSFEIQFNKPSIHINKDGSISITSIAFSDSKDPITAMTYNINDGKKSSISYLPLLTNFQDQLGNAVGFNNELWSFKNTSNNSFMVTYNDTLYVYDNISNNVKPRAFLKEKINKEQESWYVGMELPMAIIYQVLGPDKKILWYDKNSNELSTVKIINDYCGNYNISTGNFRDGYFVQIWEPDNLIDRITNQWLLENTMSNEQKTDLIKLQESLNPDNNNILFIGKLKQ